MSGADVVLYNRTEGRTFRNPKGQQQPYDEASSLTISYQNGRVAAFSGWRVDAS